MTTNSVRLGDVSSDLERPVLDASLGVRPPRGDDLPSSDGVPMESARYRAQMSVLIESLADFWEDRQDVYVGGNMFVYFSELHAKTFRGPDVFVVLDTEKRPRDKWYAWEEGGKLPDVVIELLSPSTAHADRHEKRRIYERVWKLRAYALYDPTSHTLEGHAMGPDGRFAALAPDARGDLPIEALGLSLGLRPEGLHEEPGPFLRWIDRDGQPLPLGRERAEQERQRAEQERQRAEQERHRADQERARREDAERRVAELEALLAKR
jgi:Uma2 family endonuclease